MASSEGKLFNEALSAWSSKPSGATQCVRKLIKRSMTKASANTEQIKRGQIGQPAACMMVNKANYSREFSGSNYGSVTHPHHLWITLGISFVACALIPHEMVDSTH